MNEPPSSYDESDIAELDVAGPGVVAFEYFEGLEQGEFRDYLLDDDLRLALAQRFVWTHPELPGVAAHGSKCAAALANGGGDPAIVDRYRAQTSGDASAQWRALGVPFSHLGIAGVPMPASGDLELIVVLDAEDDAPLVIADDMLMSPLYTLLVRPTDDGWRIASFASEPPIPGWPPEFSQPPFGVAG